VAAVHWAPPAGHETATSDCPRSIETGSALAGAVGSNVTSAPRRSGGAAERTVARLRAAGAVGARIMGGGFGGHILALIPHTAHAPEDAIVVTPSAGARILAPAIRAPGSGRWPPHA
jgi:hypothetical protein